MTIKTRIEKAEKAKRAATPETIETYVIFPDYVLHKGERLTRVEYDALPKGEKDTVITVKYADGQKLTDYGHPGNGPVK